MMDLVWLTASIFLMSYDFAISQPINNQQLVANSNNDFSVSLYQKLVQGNPNLICSPFSASTVLSMLWDGAGGTTSSEIQTALKYSQLTQSSVDSGYQTLLPMLNSTQDYTLNVADSIWVKDNFKIQEKYTKRMADNYYAIVSPLKGADDINNWASIQTNKLITKVIEQLPEATVMVLANAVYFKGSWNAKFDTKLTMKREFRNEDKTPKQIDMMQQTNKFPYFESSDLNAKVLVLPYTGLNMSMVLLLPQDDSSTLVDLESKLSTKNLKEAISKTVNQTVIVTIPKFEAESSLSLTEPLKQFGMKQAFTSEANFEGITGSPTGIQVSSVIQKAKIKVDEEGSEAAAVTVIALAGASINGPTPPPIPTFNANKPFMYLLYHTPTDSILFMGRFTKA